MNVSSDRILEIVREFVAVNHGDESKKISLDTLLMQEGYLDSFGLVQLISELETKLAIILPDGALIPEDFESTEILWERLQNVD